MSCLTILFAIATKLNISNDKRTKNQASNKIYRTTMVEAKTLLYQDILQCCGSAIKLMTYYYNFLKYKRLCSLHYCCDMMYCGVVDVVTLMVYAMYVGIDVRWCLKTCPSLLFLVKLWKKRKYLWIYRVHMVLDMVYRNASLHSNESIKLYTRRFIRALHLLVLGLFDHLIVNFMIAIIMICTFYTHYIQRFR